MALGRVNIKTERCKGCGVCVHVCPKKVLELQPGILNQAGYTPVTAVRPEACIGCAQCALMCPDQVLEVEREEKPGGGHA